MGRNYKYPRRVSKELTDTLNPKSVSDLITSTYQDYKDRLFALARVEHEEKREQARSISGLSSCKYLSS